MRDCWRISRRRGNLKPSSSSDNELFHRHPAVVKENAVGTGAIYEAPGRLGVGVEHAEIEIF